MFEIPEGLELSLVPLAFLLGTWEGRGVVEYPTMAPLEYRNRLTIEVVPDKAVLRHTSEAWSVETGETSHWESGFWRPGENLADVELVLAHTNGNVEVLYGRVSGVSVELGTDAVMTTQTGTRAAALTRTYGQVEGDLAYAIYLATPEVAMTGHCGARLQKVSG
ncbi:MAG TPA: FABP family protein [Mycobacteriales bacterium]